MMDAVEYLKEKEECTGIKVQLEMGGINDERL